MHFYSIGYGELLRLPITAFWELSKNVDRIRAEEDMRMFTLINHAVSGEPEKFMDRLTAERGEIVEELIENDGFDQEGMSQFKALLG